MKMVSIFICLLRVAGFALWTGHQVILRSHIETNLYSHTPTDNLAFPIDPNHTLGVICYDTQFLLHHNFTVSSCYFCGRSSFRELTDVLYSITIPLNAIMEVQNSCTLLFDNILCLLHIK